MSTTAPGRRSRARSGLDQLDVAEDLLAEVAAAVAVVVPQFVVHVLDHGRGADRRITINRVGRRRGKAGLKVLFGRQSIRVSEFLTRPKPPRGLLYTIP